MVQEKSVGNDEINIIDELEQILAYKYGDLQNMYKDETYCNKKSHTETVCFSKCDDDKLVKLAEKCIAVMADRLSSYNKEAIDTIMIKLKSLFLKGKE